MERKGKKVEKKKENPSIHISG